MKSGNQLAIDIGSTIIKVAYLGVDGSLLKQEFHSRSPEESIAQHVHRLLREHGVDGNGRKPLICSSANGGLRVGLLCLTEKLSGRVFRNQALRAGANPVYLRLLTDTPDNSPVDVLVVGGGIDCEESEPVAQRIDKLSLDGYVYSSLLYAGNSYLSEPFCTRFPHATVIDNPIATSLSGSSDSLADALRRAYLDDLVYKAGVSELGSALGVQIRPTPEIVNIGFQKTVNNDTNMSVVGPCVLLDIGGATTDVHYTSEILEEDDEIVTGLGFSVNRHVFADLGVVASADTVAARLRAHPRLYEFLSAVQMQPVRELYQSLREGEHKLPPELLAYACVFLSLDRFSSGGEPGLVRVNLSRIADVIFIGGGSQMLDPESLGRILELVFRGDQGAPRIVIDNDYQVWACGIAEIEAAREPAIPSSVISVGQ